MGIIFFLIFCIITPDIPEICGIHKVYSEVFNDKICKIKSMGWTNLDPDEIFIPIPDSCFIKISTISFLPKNKFKVNSKYRLVFTCDNNCVNKCNTIYSKWKYGFIGKKNFKQAVYKINLRAQIEKESLKGLCLAEIQISNLIINNLNKNDSCVFSYLHRICTTGNRIAPQD